MSTKIETKINQLLQSQPQGTVMMSHWLAKHGYSYDLQQRYKKSRWLKSIGSGALIRINDKICYEGAVYALQEQAELSIHPGGITALNLLGKAHYLELKKDKILLFGDTQERLPRWFKNYDWEYSIQYYESNFLPKNLGLLEFEIKNFSINISGPARAMMECLYLAPRYFDLMKCYEIMEGLNNLSPKVVQLLLESCHSFKVKRLFLYMAEKSNHSWFQFLKVKNIDLGKGKRSIVPNGCFIEKYGITVPTELDKIGKNI